MKTTDALNLAETFEAQQNKRPTDVIPSTEEIEYKHVLDFPSDTSAKGFATKNGLKYPSEFIVKALISEGFVVSRETSTKNLSSYYYDTKDRTLNARGISLRMRHNETPQRETQSEDFEAETPDLSFKIPTQSGSTVKRLEYQEKTKIHGDFANGVKFSMSFKGLVERYTQEIMERSGAQAAVQWAEATYKTLGFDWDSYREHFSINCKRTKPYVTLYTLKDADNNLLRHDDGSVRVYKQQPEIIPDTMECRAIVWQFCLDTNRFFANDTTNLGETVKYHVDHEIEYELQVGVDEYEKDGLACADDITYEEAYAARAIINDLIKDSMAAYNVKECPLHSGESKQARGFHAIDRHNERTSGAKIKPADTFTIRGRTNMHKIKAYSWDGMVKDSPALTKATRAASINQPLFGLKKVV
ncbi:MAG: hypothetical protein COB76_05120 [Alphaproteobacteria bacterium]|nr:MAG: hypothetical protein COB76_05120 [Alphaproteobacteria bacterium]